MQEIKYRAKDLDNGDWLYGGIVQDDTNKNYYIIPQQSKNDFLDHYGNHFGKYTAINQTTIGKYTGIKDIDGRQIFEGDIVCETQEHEWGEGWREVAIKHKVRFTRLGIVKYGEYKYKYVDDTILGFYVEEIKFDAAGNTYDLNQTYSPCDLKLKVIGNMHEKTQYLEETVKKILKEILANITFEFTAEKVKQ